MKKMFSLLLPAIAVIAILSLSSCSEEPATQVNESDLLQSSISSYADFDISDEDGITYSTLETELAVRPPDPGRDRNPRFVPLWHVLRSLELTEEQKAEIKDCFTAHRECVAFALRNMYAESKPIITEANALRREVMEKLKNNLLTREEAKMALDRINLSVRNQLKPIRIETCEALKECREALFDCIGGELNEEQLVKWNEWLSKLPDIPCDRENIGTGPRE